MRKSIMVCLFCLFLSPAVLAGGTGTVFAAEFTAKMQLLTGKTSQEGKLYCQGQRYRMEQQQQGREIDFLVDQNTGMTTVLLVNDKKFVQIPVIDRQSLMSDPFQGTKFMAKQGESVSEGSETIEGYECDKTTVSIGGQKGFTVWTARKLDFPIKIVLHTQPERTVLLTEINETDVADELFAIPEGYTLFTAPGASGPAPVSGPPIIPDWVGEVKNAPKLDAPFVRELKSGKMFRIPLPAGSELVVNGTNADDSASTFIAVAFNDGIPIESVDQRRYKLSAKGRSSRLTFEQTPAEADEIVLRVEKGAVKFKVEAVKLLFAEELSAGAEKHIAIPPGKPMRAKFTNREAGESSCLVTFQEKGVPLGDDIVGPVSVRTFTVSGLGDAAQRTWISTADKMTIKVTKGKLRVRIVPEAGPSRPGPAGLEAGKK